MHQTLLHAECWNWLHTTNPRHGSMIKVRKRGLDQATRRTHTESRPERKRQKSLN